MCSLFVFIYDSALHFFIIACYDVKLKKCLNLSWNLSVLCTVQSGTSLVVLLMTVTVTFRIQHSHYGNFMEAHGLGSLLKAPYVSWTVIDPLWRVSTKWDSLPCLLWFTHQYQSVFSGLLNCFECCGKWIILNWKSRQIWFRQKTIQGFQRGQQKGLGLVWFLRFQCVQTSPKGKQLSYPESKHFCVSKKTWKASLMSTWTIEPPSLQVQAKFLLSLFHL